MTTPGMAPDNSSYAPDLVPRPDPTKLTTEAVERVTEQFQREVASLRDLHDRDIATLRDTWEARLAAVDTQRDVLRDAVSAWPDQLEARLLERRREFENEVANLRESLETRLAGNDDNRDLLWADVRAWPERLEGRLARHEREGTDALASIRELLEQRMNSMDRAVEVALESRERFLVPLLEKYDTRIGANREYATSQLEIYVVQAKERFESIQGQFLAGKEAVDAAFDAANKAVAEQNRVISLALDKSDATTSDQIAALSRVTDAGIAGLADKIDDARNRITTIESLTQGIAQAGGEQREERGLAHGSVQLAISAAAILIAIVSVTVAIIVATRPH